MIVEHSTGSSSSNSVEGNQAPVADAQKSSVPSLLSDGAEDFLYHRLRLVNKRLLELIQFLGQSAIAANETRVLFSEEIQKRLDAEEEWKFSSEEVDFEPVRKSREHDPLWIGHSRAGQSQPIFCTRSPFVTSVPFSLPQLRSRTPRNPR